MKKLFLAVFLLAAVGCGINSVTKAELEAVKPGNVLTYRYQKAGKSWFYADKITRVEGDKIYYNPSLSESTSGSDARLQDFDTSKEMSMPKADLLKYENEQPEDQKVIIWIS